MRLATSRRDPGAPQHSKPPRDFLSAQSRLHHVNHALRAIFPTRSVARGLRLSDLSLPVQNTRLVAANVAPRVLFTGIAVLAVRAQSQI